LEVTMGYDQEDTRKYKVVKSVRGYISIWLSHKEIPKGCPRQERKVSSKNVCNTSKKTFLTILI
jgi:hypothetical protein